MLVNPYAWVKSLLAWGLFLCYYNSIMAIKNNFWFYASKVAIGIIFRIIYFPLWWYSRGLLNLLLNLRRRLLDELIYLNIGVWIKNFWTPMYGQHDITSRLISLVIRLLQIIYRSLVILFWVLWFIILIILWLALPLLILYIIYRQWPFSL